MHSKNLNFLILNKNYDPPKREKKTLAKYIKLQFSLLFYIIIIIIIAQNELWNGVFFRLCYSVVFTGHGCYFAMFYLHLIKKYKITKSFCTVPTCINYEASFLQTVKFSRLLLLYKFQQNSIIKITFTINNIKELENVFLSGQLRVFEFLPYPRISYIIIIYT